MANVVIIGGHGKVALRLARLLTERGDRVRSVIRNPDHSAEVTATGASPVIADIEQLDTAGMAALLAPNDVVVFSAGAGGGNPTRTYAVDRDAAIRSMIGAQQAGVARYIMVSYFGARPDHGVPEDNSFHAYAEAKSAADTHLKDSELRWTILGPSALTDEPGSGKIEVGGSRVDGAQVSRDNVAAVAAAVIADPATAGRVIEFNDGDTPIAEAL